MPEDADGVAADSAVGVEIFEWANSLPAWQQDAIVRLLNLPELSVGELELLERRVLHDVGILEKKPDAETLEVTVGLFTAASDETALSIDRLGQLKGVGGLCGDGQELDFAPTGLTIVYGGNAAGKTSYARTLKYVGKAAGERPVIQSDVRAEQNDEPPTAAISLTLGSGEWSDQVDLSAPAPEQCSSIRAFDSRCAESYVSENNAVDFTPRILLVFDRLVAAQTVVSTKIKERREVLEDQEPDLTGLREGTVAQVLLGGLTAESSFAEVEKLAALTEEETVELKTLKEELALSKEAISALAERQKVQTEAARNLAGRLKAINNLVGDDALAARVKLRDSEIAKADAAKASEATTFAGAPMPDLSTEAWRELWASAERYIRSGEGEHVCFPAVDPGERCPLCFQELDDAARERFRGFQAFLEDETAKQATEAHKSYEDSVNLLIPPLPNCRGEFLNHLVEVRPDLGTSIGKYLDAADLRIEVLRSDPVAKPAEGAPTIPFSDLEVWAVECEDKRDGLLANLDKSEIEKKEIRRNELGDRAVIKNCLDECRSWHLKLKESALLKLGENRLSTRSLTTKQGELSEQIIDETFRDALRRELDGLGLHYMDIDFNHRGRLGTRVVRLHLTNLVQRQVPLVQILSEGEQRAIALAYYLAEASTEGQGGPLVLDDPISSFDQERREKVAIRLVEEAKSRQVIVFTHDLPFVCHLTTASRDRNVDREMRSVTRRGTVFGVIEPDGPIEAQGVGSVCSELQGRVGRRPSIETGTEQDERQFVQHWYTDLRRAWERTVEKEMLASVVTRFDREVRTNSLSSVRLNADLIESVTTAMTHCSMHSHDKPDADNTELPSIEDMKVDIESLVQFRKALKDA